MKTALRLFAADGGTPENLNGTWWLLPIGAYSAELTDGGSLQFEVTHGPDGGFELAPSSLSWLSPSLWLSRPDAGSGLR